MRAKCTLRSRSKRATEWRIRPLWLGQHSASHVTTEDGLYRFFIEISHPLTGLIVRCQGWLTTTPPACFDESPSA